MNSNVSNREQFSFSIWRQLKWFLSLMLSHNLQHFWPSSLELIWKALQSLGENNQGNFGWNRSLRSLKEIEWDIQWDYLGFLGLLQYLNGRYYVLILTKWAEFCFFISQVSCSEKHIILLQFKYPVEGQSKDLVCDIVSKNVVYSLTSE